MKRAPATTAYIPRIFLAILAFLVLTLALPSATELRVTVLDRVRIGGYAEDITFVSTGPLANHIILVDGYDVYAIPGQGHGNSPMRRLFDLRDLGIESVPTGITYIESERLFAVGVAQQPTTLFLVDHRGRPQGTRTIQYLNNYLPDRTEGLAYIPATSSVYPDHLLMAVHDKTSAQSPRIEIMRRDGQVVAEIFPELPLEYSNEWIGGIAFFSPDQLLITFYTSTIWRIDFAGNILAGPLDVVSGGDLGGGEGIVQLRDGRVVFAAFPQDLLFFDSALNRLPAEDRHDVIGLNLNTPSGVAWNSDTGKHLIVARVPPSSTVKVSAVPPSLNTASEILDMGPNDANRSGAMTYLADEHLMAIAHSDLPRAILLYDNTGALVDQVNLGVEPYRRPGAITYIPATQKFALGGPGWALSLYSRDGLSVETIDLTSIGLTGLRGIAYFNPGHPSGGQFLIIDSLASERALITDFNGSLLGEFNYRSALGLVFPTDVSAITTGPQAGAFCMIDSRCGEMVVFRID